jgi:hypothetical protein
MPSNHREPGGVFGHGRSEKKNRPAARVGEIIFFAISLIARASDVAATIINTTLYFDASARVGVSKVKTIPLRAFTSGIALLIVFFPGLNVAVFPL